MLLIYIINHTIYRKQTQGSHFLTLASGRIIHSIIYIIYTVLHSFHLMVMVFFTVYILFRSTVCCIVQICCFNLYRKIPLISKGDASDLPLKNHNLNFQSWVQLSHIIDSSQLVGQARLIVTETSHI